MKRALTALLFSLAGIFATGCINDASQEEGKTTAPVVEEGQVDIVLKLKNPGRFSPAGTRALDQAQENDIDDVWVLVFESGQLIDIKQGLDPKTFGPDPAKPEYSGRGTFTVVFEAEMLNRSCKLVVLANASDILSSTTGTDIKSFTGSKAYGDVVGAIHTEFKAKFTGSVIPMWGEAENVTIAPKGIVTLELMRTFARIDVGVGRTGTGQTNANRTWDGLDAAGKPIPFELTEVVVMRPSNRFAAVPGSGNVTGLNQKGKVTTPTIPLQTSQHTDNNSRVAFTYNDIEGVGTTGGGYTTRSIYVPEADVKRTPDGKSGDKNHTERMAIVVGGIYDKDTEPSFYRLDFLQGGSLIDVLRNTLYQFNITAVTGRGYDDPVEAYRNTSMNMKVDILDWNEVDLDNGFIVGDHYFAISGREVVFTPMKGQIHKVTIKTDITDFTMSLDNNVEIAANGNRSFDSDNFRYTLDRVGTTEEYTLTIETLKANVFDKGSELVDKWSIAIGRVNNIAFTVRQEWMSDYVSIGDGTTTLVYPEGVSGANGIPIEIVSGSQPVTSVTGGNGWIPAIPAPINSGGVWSLQTSLDIPAYNGANDRTATIAVTIDGRTMNYTITQQAPWLRLVPADMVITRPAQPGEVREWVTVQTNLLRKDIAFDFGEFTGTAGITNTSLSPISSRSRNLRFEVVADTGAVPPAGAKVFYSATPASWYGLLKVDGTVTVLGSNEVYKFLWIEGIHSGGLAPWTPQGDATQGYHFPWSTSSVKFSIESNSGLKPAPGSSTLNGGALTENSTSAGYPPVTSYTFTFAGGSRTTQLPQHKLEFAPQHGGGNRTVSFTLGIQKWSGGENFATSWSRTGTGAGANTFEAIPVESNVEWQASSDAGWLTLSVTTSGFGASTRRDDRVADPATDPAALVKKGDLNVHIEPIATLNALGGDGHKRTASITFANNSGGLDLSSKTIAVTQYAPVLKVGNGYTLSDVAAGGDPAYAVSALTNLPGWVVSVYSVTDNSGNAFAGGVSTRIATSTHSGAVIDPKAAAGNSSQTVEIPAYTGGTERTLELRLSHPDFTGEITVGTFKQAAGAIFVVDTTWLMWKADDTTSQTTSVNSNLAWDAKLDDNTWFTIAKTPTGVVVTPKSVNDTTNDRAALLTVSAPGQSDQQLIVFHYATAPYITLSPNSKQIWGESDTNVVAITVTSNIAWEIDTNSYSATDWNVTKTSTGFTVAPIGANTSIYARGTTIRVMGTKASGYSQTTATLDVEQAASSIPVIEILTDASISMTWGATETDIRWSFVQSNIEWEVDHSSYSTNDWKVTVSNDWFGVEPNGPNTSATPRTARIKVKGTAASGSPSVYATLDVTQLANAAPTISLNPSVKQFWGAKDTNVVTITVTANFAWEIDTSSFSTADWIVSQTATGFTVAPNGENTSPTARTGTIKVRGTAASGHMTVGASIDVEQSPALYRVYILPKSGFTLRYNAAGLTAISTGVAAGTYVEYNLASIVAGYSFGGFTTNPAVVDQMDDNSEYLGFDMPASDVTITVVIPTPEGLNNRITWDSYSNRYVLTVDPTDVGLYFRRHSVLGIFSAHGYNWTLPKGPPELQFEDWSEYVPTNDDEFHADKDIAWSPFGALRITGSEDPWSYIPYILSRGEGVEDPQAGNIFHTIANIKEGKGDPCRLVGLDLERIRNKILYGEELTYKDIDNGVWRLPTLKETHIFMDYNDYYGLPANAHWTSFSGVVGGSFPSADAGFNAFLPAAGYREGYAFTTNNQQGGVMMQGYWGYYMSSAGSAMWFNDIYSETRASDTDGIAASVRCVRQ